MLFLYHAKFKYCECGEVHKYVMPLHIDFVAGQLPGFFLGRKIVENQSNESKHKDIKQTKAEIYESLYDAE